MNGFVDIVVIKFIWQEGAQSEFFLNKCFEGGEEFRGTMYLLETMKWGVWECRCFCDMVQVWVNGHVGGFGGHLIV